MAYKFDAGVPRQGRLTTLPPRRAPVRRVIPADTALNEPLSPAIFIDQLHFSIFKSPANGRWICQRHRGLLVDRILRWATADLVRESWASLETIHRTHISKKLALEPTDERTSFK
jgi:hypothetical protein